MKIVQIAGKWPDVVALTDDGRVWVRSFTDAGYAAELVRALGGNVNISGECFCWQEVSIPFEERKS